MHDYDPEMPSNSVSEDLFLNLEHASRRPVHAWFVKIDPVRIVGVHACVCVCVSAPEAINN